jgi:PQQ-like domain
VRPPGADGQAGDPQASPRPRAGPHSLGGNWYSADPPPAADRFFDPSVGGRYYGAPEAPDAGRYPDDPHAGGQYASDPRAGPRSGPRSAGGFSDDRYGGYGGDPPASWQHPGGHRQDTHAAGWYANDVRGGSSDGWPGDHAGGPGGPGASGSRPRGGQGAHLPPRHDRRRLVALLLAGTLLAGAAAAVQFVVFRDDDGGSSEEAAPPGSSDTTASTEARPEEAEPAAAASGFETPGLLTFRGSPTRSYYGQGPLPENPQVVWDYPGESGGMCSESSVGSETKVWCGTGWTGQPSVFERDGRTWVVFGAYDRHVHFVDYETGEDIIPPFPTGDIIKGSVSVDPDGYPLVYSGSRDNRLHVISIDGPEPTELWSLDAEAVQPTLWNDDWDGSPLVIDDYLYEGGENSQFHIVKLNRSYAEDGSVQVAPELVFNAPSWDDELLSALGDQEVSVENSVAIHGGVVYFANSGGLVQGWDVSGIERGVEPTRVFRFWTGDDTDASIVVDDEGFLYVASEYERFNARSDEVGQLMKLDPRQPDNPLVWSVHDPDATSGNTAGIWATPALHGDLVIAPTNGGDVLGVDRETGEIRWQFALPPPTWQSPVVIDDVLLQGDCNGVLHAYDLSDTTVQPPELWTVELGGCIESTPAVWNGRIFVGTRGGRFFAVGDP